MLDQAYENIRKLELFAKIDDGNFGLLMRAAYVQNFPAQIELITEGEPSDFVHVVISGTVDLFSTWNGRDTSLTTIRPISTFILAASIRNTPYFMSARTLEKSRIALIPSQDVRAVFEKDAEFARAIGNELARGYCSVIKAQKDLKLRSSLERLANYLLRQQRLSGGSEVFELVFEKRRLASVLAMSPENLSRAFRNLQSYGVNVSGSRISINSQSDLEHFAKPHSLIDDLSA